jgi:nucleoside-diphosphate kinase
MVDRLVLSSKLRKGRLVERTLILAKPDAVQRGLVGEIVSRFERRGLQIVGMKFMNVSTSLAREHYKEHVGKPFFKGLVEYITSSPIIAAVFEGNGAIKATRQTMGLTNPLEAAPGSIRADFGLEKGRNLTHASDSPTSARREIGLFFRDAPPIAWKRGTDAWVFE